MKPLWNTEYIEVYHNILLQRGIMLVTLNEVSIDPIKTLKNVVH